MNQFKKLSVVVFLGLCAHLSVAGAAVTCVVNKATGHVEGAAGSKPNPECSSQGPANVLAGMLAEQDIEESEGTKIVGGTIITNAPKLSAVVLAANAERKSAKMAALADDMARSRSVVPVTVQSAPEPSAQKMIVKETEVWSITAGDSLRRKLEEWCERAGYRLEWRVEKGFVSGGSNAFEGDFKKAVVDLFASIPEELHLSVEVAANKLVFVTRGAK